MSESPGGHRAKRLKVDKHGRMSALEKLRQLKGSKRKYEVEEEVENVYDTVDEEEYSERVLQRQEHDWIEDDDGCGYVEDGREIFDDDEVEDTFVASSSGKDGSSRGQKRKARVAASAASGKGNIRNLLGNMPAKKKEEIKTSDDSILSDIMSDLDSTPGTSLLKPKILPTSKTNIADSGERDAKNYFKNLSSNTKRTAPTSFMSHQSAPVQVKTEMDEKLIDIKTWSKKLSPHKPKWNILDDIKEEKDENTPTQQIEEFNSQAYHFDNGDFDNDDLEGDDENNDESIKKTDDSAKRIAEPVKKSGEPAKENGESVKKERKDSIGSNMDGVNVEAFLDDDFEIFGNTKAEVKNKDSGKPSVKSEDVPTTTWSGQNDTPTIQSTSYDCSNLPLQTNESGEKVLHFYWWDAWEDRFVKPGVVYLFGKVYTDPNNTKAGCVSCCLTVKNVMRKLFLLPREYKLNPNTQQEDPDNQNSIRDVYNEFNSQIADKIGIKEFKSRPVSRNYAFNLPSVPAQSEYLEVKYEATYPPPRTDKQYETISHIFGTNTSSLETFLLERKVKGPCWLEIRSPINVQAKVSWCKMEVACARMEDVSVLRTDHNLKPPPLVVATLNMRTAMDQKTRKTKIVMLSCLVHNNFEIHKPAPNPPFQTHFCVFTRCNDIWPIDLKQTMSQYKATRLTKCDSERELLNYFLVQFWKLDADLVLGHDLQGFQQDLLIGNVLDLNIPNWSRLGRLKRSVVPQRMYISKDAFLGRLVCDVKLSAMELIRSRSYDLDTLCASVLKVKEGERKDIVPEELQRYYENGRDLMHLVSLTMQDTSYIAKIMCELNVLPLALQITQIAGNVMSRTLMGGRSERNEFLLLHAFTEKDYVVPDKEYGKKAIDGKNTVENEEGDETNVTNVSKKQARKKPAYSGGLVLEPKKGFYDKLILLMDFNSLYPSIIQEYNICFTTVKRDNNITSDEDIAKMVLPDTKTEPGVLPTQIRRLVESRREVKKLMKTPDLSPEQYMQYNIRQLALKLTANSMYGCLGFTHSRFYAKPLAALITMKGREILMDTQDIVQRLNYEVIYGDTDSLMINTNCLDYDQVFKIGHELKKEINKKYKQIELDIDGVFRYLLLLKKKKYAAVLLSRNKNGEFVTTQEHKGLDIVRRDWSQLAAEAGKFILSQILSEQNADDRIESIQTHLVNLKEDILESKMPLSMLTITKQLTKNPDEYADKNGQPHVQVALRLNSKNGRRFKKGDIVPYLICVDGTPNPPTQRAYHIEELKNSETLKVDVNYYLAQQLHPVISRICDPIEGMDAARIANCLGLDPSGYKHAVKRDNNTNDEYEIENDKEKYRHCKDFVYTCYECKTVNKIHDTFIKNDKETVTFLEKCQGENCKLVPIDCLYRIQNELSRQIREYILIYYDNYLVCEDPACTNRTARLPQSFVAGYPLCQLCQKGVMYREYTEKDLYLQINFFYYLFDLNKQNISKIRVPPHVTSAFHTLKEMVEDALTHSGYSVIDLSVLFRFFVLDKKSEKEENNVMEVDVTPETEQRDACLEMGAAVGDAFEEV